MTTTSKRNAFFLSILSQIPPTLRDETTTKVETLTGDKARYQSNIKLRKGIKACRENGKGDVSILVVSFRELSDESFQKDRRYKCKPQQFGDVIHYIPSGKFIPALVEYIQTAKTLAEEKAKVTAQRQERLEEQHKAWDTFAETIPEGFNTPKLRWDQEYDMYGNASVDIHSPNRLACLTINYSTSSRDYSITNAGLRLNIANPDSGSIEGIATLAQAAEKAKEAYKARESTPVKA